MARNGQRGVRRQILDLISGQRTRAAFVGLAVVVLAGGVAVPALAQSWWPFGGNDEQPRSRPGPVPSAPVYGDPDDPASQGQPGLRGNSVCLELEQRLVQEGQRGGDSRNLIPMVQNELRQVEDVYRGQRRELDRADCYEYFLFSKTLKKSRRCVDLANQADDARRRIDDLEVQLRQLEGSSGRSYQDEIIRELARNNCGPNYQQQARRQSGGGISGFWDDEESSGGYGGGSSFGALPYATYRTVCVRLCDGYYFPVSFSTLPNHFQRDEEVCHSKCASPASLYYHQNPGAGMEQAVEARSNVPYTQLKSAFLYRKQYVNGCSCKMAEYKPEPGVTVEQGAGGAGDGWTAQVPTGSTGGQAPPPSPPPQQAPQGGGEQLPWSTAP
ncbi:DUF2865 domain-containing protein [uncultured Hyphomicrobium sp.]|uniref:DUF2865 domain-containing protein n=1 Tax=uncultured Hyphomicrobium sp. TaxID=194373 RepID=UPI0025E40E0C|nr:DUF2865 domain-containing protein [uncultured Hyphomicrobium sp.]